MNMDEKRDMQMKFLIALTVAAPLIFAAVGCGGNNEIYLTEERLDNGLVIVLPGIEGVSPFNRDIRKGLKNAGVYKGLPIHSWGRPIPIAGVLLNQMDFIGNRLAGQKIAQLIVDYQDSHPGRPVHIVGHSGGGGVAVFAAEAMPEGRKIDGLILLSASISHKYDLTKALGHCRNGIVNFYNPKDTGLLSVGTTLVGNVDGAHGPSSGLSGFEKPSDDSDLQMANSSLYQVHVTDRMTGGGDAHMGTTKASFVVKYVAPWVTRSPWPPGVGGFTRGVKQTLSAR